MGLSMEGHATGLGRSFVLPPFSMTEQCEETFPGESGGGVAPPPPNVGIHLGTYQCPYNAPSLGSTNPLYPPTPWWQGFYLSCPHNAALADFNN